MKLNKNNKKRINKKVISLISLMLASVTLLSSCLGGNGGKDTTKPEDTTDKPVDTTIPVTPSEVVLAESSLSVPLFETADFMSLSENAAGEYVTMSLPIGMGGGYRVFTAESEAVADRIGIKEIKIEALCRYIGDSFDSHFSLNASLLSLFAFGGKTESLPTVLSTKKASLENGGSFYAFFTLEKIGGKDYYRAYSFAVNSEKTVLLYFVADFGAMENLRRKDTEETLIRIASSVRSGGADYNSVLAEGANGKAFLLFDNLKEGYSCIDVERYSDTALALLITDARNELYISFYDVNSNSLYSNMTKLGVLREETPAIYMAQEGFVVGLGGGRYSAVSGSPNRPVVTVLSRMFDENIYSQDGELRATVLQNKDLVAVTVASDEQSIVYPASANGSYALPVAFSNGHLVYNIFDENGVVGYGVYDIAEGTSNLCKTGSSVVNVTENMLWGEKRGEEREEFFSAKLSSPADVTYIASKNDLPEGADGAFSDTLLSGKIYYSDNGNYITVESSDTVPSITVYDVRDKKASYTTPLAGLIDVVAYRDRLILVAGGYGVIYNVEYPKSSHEETKDADREEALAFLSFVSKYFVTNAENKDVLPSSALLYYTLDFAKQNKLFSYKEGQKIASFTYETVVEWADRIVGMDEEWVKSFSETDDGVFEGADEGDYYNKVAEMFVFDPKDHGKDVTLEKNGAVVTLDGDTVTVSAAIYIREKIEKEQAEDASTEAAVPSDLQEEPKEEIKITKKYAVYTLQACTYGSLEYYKIIDIKISDKRTNDGSVLIPLGNASVEAPWIIEKKDGKTEYIPTMENSLTPSGILRVERDSDTFKDENVLTDAEITSLDMTSARAIVGIKYRGVYDTYIYDFSRKSGKWVSGANDLSRYENEMKKIEAREKAYSEAKEEDKEDIFLYTPYLASYPVALSPDGTKLLVLKSTALSDNLVAKYGVYMIATGEYTPLVTTNASNGKYDFIQWMNTSSVRLAVRGNREQAVYDCTLRGGSWSYGVASYKTSGSAWEYSVPSTDTAEITTHPMGYPDDGEETTPPEIDIPEYNGDIDSIELVDLTDGDAYYFPTLSQVEDSFKKERRKRALEGEGIDPKIETLLIAVIERGDDYVVVSEMASFTRGGSTRQKEFYSVYSKNAEGKWEWSVMELPKFN